MILARPIPIEWNPELSIYASESFLQAVSDEYGWIGGFDESDELRCILPYTIIKKSFYRLLRFRVATIAFGKELSIWEEKDFLNRTISLFRIAGVDMLIPATTNTIFRTYPDGADAAPYGTYIVNLDLPEEVLWRAFSSSHRRKVRLAEKRGVAVESDMEFLPVVYDQVKSTFKRSALPFMNFPAFARMITGLGTNVKIFVASSQGIIQASLVLPFSNYSAYFVYGGSNIHPEYGAANLLHWTAMQWCKNHGIHRYDFVGVRINPKKGSKQEGLKIFKERFGGNLVQGYMWKYAFHPFKCAGYSLAVRLLRGGDIVDHERHKMSQS